MQAEKKNQPLSVNTNTGLLKLKPNEATFLKNYRLAFGRNQAGEMGGNFGVAKKFQSNWQAIPIVLPDGVNKTVLFYEHKNLNEAYYGVWNSKGLHTLYLLYGSTLTSAIVYQGPELGFTIDPANFIAEHRCYVRLIYDIKDNEDRHLREKIFVFTDGQRWQCWINVLSAVATQGYRADLFPYYKLFGPHFDANEFLDYAIRPPMYCPVVTPLPRTAADINLPNHNLNKSLSFAYRYINTDGRGSTLSPYSNPVFVSKTSCAASTSLTRSYDLAFYAGSAHTEQVQVFVRNCGDDWMLYDTLYKFTSDGANAPDLIGDAYWTRTKPWAGYTYDEVSNTIHYVFSGDRQLTPIAKDDAFDFYNNVPIRSVALTAAGDALIWCNNLFNYNNLPSEVMKNFQLTVGPAGNGTGGCIIKTVKISLYAYMGRDANISQPVYSVGSAPTAQKRFGGVTFFDIFGVVQEVVWDSNESEFFGLDFGLNNNFTCYLAGTPYLATGVQFIVNSDGTMTETDNLDSTNAEHKVLIRNTLASGGYFIQKFVLNVPAGNYIARLTRHNADITAEYQATSTYVQGIIDHNKLIITPGVFHPNPVAHSTKEFRIDATAGDVDVWNTGTDLFYIFVPYINANKFTAIGLPAIVSIGSHTSYRFIEGNLLEDSVNLLNDRLPVEMVNYKPAAGDADKIRTGIQTDHNGFFFAYTAGGKAYGAEVLFYGNFKCAYNSFICATQILKATNSDSGFFPGQVLTIQDNYDLPTAESTRIVIGGKLVDCDSGNGIPNIGVTLTNGPTFYTDTNGVFTYFARGYFAGPRNDVFYFNSGGACLFTGCDCRPLTTLPFTTDGIACDPISPRTGPQDILVKLKLLVQNGKGLKRGGRYGININAIDAAGRTTFSQPVDYVNIPTFMETGDFGALQLSWKTTGKLKLPLFVKYITFSRTENLSFLPAPQWVGDKIDFIDSKGNIIPSGIGAVRARITIQSLLNFNIENNFNTNVNYQFVAGDMLRIMDDGAGNLFNPANTNGFMDYQILGTTYNQSIEGATSNLATVSNAVATAPDGSKTTTTTTTNINPVNATDDGVSFIIEFDERLLALSRKTGFWIEFQRPRDLQTIEKDCEIIGTIDVIAGEPVITAGVLDTFDTYYQQRTIRIPNALGQTFAHPFESASVTDFSIGNCSSCGRVNVPDPLARQTWYEDEIIETDEIINEGRVNGLGRCREKNRKNFKGQTFGGIVAAHAERKRIIFICELDWFVTDYQMNYVKATPQGLLQSNTDETVSDAFAKEGSLFGCAYEDTATIVFHDGTSIWADRLNAAIVALDYRHNQSVVPMGYRDAVDITAEDTKSYFVNKFNYLLNYNASLGPDEYLDYLMEIIAGIDPLTGEYNITFRPRNGLSAHPQYFVNDEREVFYDLAETFIYNPDFKKWVSYAGYAPEFYGKLSKAVSGQEMIAFAAGLPWFHNTIGQTGSMNFFGVQTNQVIEMALNVDEEKVKIFQSLVTGSPDLKYFVDKIITEDERFFSYIPKAYVKKKEQVFYSSFLCNMGTYPNVLKPVPSMLVDGKRTFGKVALVRLVSDMETADQYGEFNGVMYKVAGSEISGK